MPHEMLTGDVIYPARPPPPCLTAPGEIQLKENRILLPGFSRNSLISPASPVGLAGLRSHALKINPLFRGNESFQRHLRSCPKPSSHSVRPSPRMRGEGRTE